MSGPKSYLCFEVNEQQYAIPLLAAKEVIAVPSITPVPGSDTSSLGIINLRGDVISLYDLRMKFGSEKLKNDQATAIILDSEKNSAGVVVDRVDSVLSLDEDQISPPTMTDSSPMSHYVLGICKIDSRLILVIDIGRVFNIPIRNNQLFFNVPKAA